jgi:hypothetical protein
MRADAIGTVVGRIDLLYAKAGYTNAQAKLTSDDGTARSRSTRATSTACASGPGVEHAVGPRSYVKAEYRYSNYEAGVQRHQAWRASASASDAVLTKRKGPGASLPALFSYPPSGEPRQPRYNAPPHSFFGISG